MAISLIALNGAVAFLYYLCKKGQLEPEEIRLAVGIPLSLSVAVTALALSS